MRRRRTNEEREEDLREAMERALAGERQADIARDLGVSQQQISRDLETVICSKCRRKKCDP